MRPWKIVWLCWCGFWAFAWLLAGIFTLGLGWLMVPVSLLLMLIVLVPDQQRAVHQAPAYAYVPPWQPQAEPHCNYCGQPRSRHAGPAETVCPRAELPPPPPPAQTWPQTHGTSE